MLRKPGSRITALTLQNPAVLANFIGDDIVQRSGRYSEFKLTEKYQPIYGIEFVPHVFKENPSDFPKAFYKYFMGEILQTEKPAGIKQLAQLLAHLSIAKKRKEERIEQLNIISTILLNSETILDAHPLPHGSLFVSHITIRPSFPNFVELVIEKGTLIERVTNALRFTRIWTYIKLPIEIFYEKKDIRYKAFLKFIVDLCPDTRGVADTEEIVKDLISDSAEKQSIHDSFKESLLKIKSEVPITE